MPTPTTPDAAVTEPTAAESALEAVESAAGSAAAGSGAESGAAQTSPGAAATTAASAPVPVLSGRVQIDALDEQIAGLILRRIEVSRAIQAARIADGGRRVDLRRESEIIGRYRAALGKPGTGIAMALLELCRGRA